MYSSIFARHYLCQLQIAQYLFVFIFVNYELHNVCLSLSLSIMNCSMFACLYPRQLWIAQRSWTTSLQQQKRTTTQTQSQTQFNIFYYHSSLIMGTVVRKGFNQDYLMITRRGFGVHWALLFLSDDDDDIACLWQLLWLLTMIMMAHEWILNEGIRAQWLLFPLSPISFYPISDGLAKKRKAWDHPQSLSCCSRRWKGRAANSNQSSSTTKLLQPEAQVNFSPAFIAK